MQIHVLIPIPHPTYPGPDPPENIYHYTTVSAHHNQS